MKSKIPASPNKYVTWWQVLPLLNVPLTAGAPPFDADCPLCGSQHLSIYQDNIFGGNWHHCFGCGSTGDLLELAAKTWALSMRATLVRLAQHGIDFPPDTTTAGGIAAYQEYHLDVRQRVNAFWEHARRNLINHSAHGGNIARNLRIQKDLPIKLWLERGGRYIGGTHWRVAERLFRPNSKPGKGQHRMFPGRNWDDLLVLPFHDLPHRICGFLFIGRDGGTADFVYRSLGTLVTSGNRFASPPVETGLFMYDVLFTRTAGSRQFGNTIFVVNSPVIAARMQARHLLDHDLPLPITSTYTTQTMTTSNKPRRLVAHTTWESQPGFRYVFWNPQFSTNILSLAARLGGRVLFVGRDINMQRMTTRSWLSYIHAHAEPWQVVLERALRNMPHRLRINVLKRLDIPAGIFKTFIHKCHTDLRNALEDSEAGCKIVNTAYIGKEKVIEDAAGWRLGNNTHVSNTIIRIDHLIQRRDQFGECYYQGRLIQGDKEVNFVEHVDALAKRGPDIIAKRLSNAGMQTLIGNAHYKRQLFDIALQLRPPQTIVSTGSFGWDHQLARFIFPHYELCPGGAVVSKPSILADSTSPCLNFRPPIGPVKFGSLLDDSPANHIFWALAACVGANVIGRPLGRRPTGIGIIGLGANCAGQYAAKLFGCNVHQLCGQPSRIYDAAVNIQRVVNEHNWPVWLRAIKATSRNVLRTWQSLADDKDAILTVNRYVADALALQSPWRFVVYQPIISTPMAMGMDGEGIFVRWLHDFASRKLELADRSGTFASRVLLDIAHWVERNGGNSAAVIAASQLIDDINDGPTAQADGFVAMLYRFIADGQLGIQQEGFADPKVKRALYRIRNKKAFGIFISRATLNALLAKNTLLPIDPPRITTALANAGALDCECEYNGEVGWLVIESWWHEHLEQCRSRQQLHVVK